LKILKMKIHLKLKIENWKFSKGSSLLELLIYLAVLAIISGVVSGIFMSINKGKGASDSRTEVSSNLRFVFDKIAQDIRSATSSANIITPSDTAIPTGILTLIVGGNTISYSTTSDNRLQRTAGSGPEIITSSLTEITGLMFKRLETTNTILNQTYTSVEIMATSSFRSLNPEQQYIESRKTTVGIRK